MTTPAHHISMNNLIAGYRAEMVSPPDDQACVHSETYLKQNLDRIFLDLMQLRAKTDLHFTEIREKDKRGEIEIDAALKAKLAGYPVSCCLEITRHVLFLISQEISSDTFKSMPALQQFSLAGGTIKRVWGALRGEYFQNAIQAGSYYIDVANDTVDPTKPKVEILPLERSKFKNIETYQEFADVGEKYWNCQMIPNVYFKNLAPWFPIISFDSEGGIYLESNNAYMFPMNLVSMFQLARDYVFNSEIQSEKLLSCQNKLGQLINGKRVLDNAELLYFSPEKNEDILRESFENCQATDRPTVEKNCAVVLGMNNNLGKIDSNRAYQIARNAQTPIDQALTHHGAGDLRKAKSIYKKILRDNPDDPIALHLLGVLYHQSGKHERAIKSIRKAIILAPEYAEAHCNLGVALLGSDDLAGAIAAYRKAIDLKPDYAEAHNNLGNALKSMGKLDEAAETFSKALRINPELAEVHYNLGNTFKDLSRLEEAIQCYLTVINLKPEHYKARTELANAYQLRGEFDQAITNYRHALNINVGYSDASNNLGLALHKINKTEDAITVYLELISKNPDFAEAHNNLGIVYQGVQRFDDAIASYQKAVSVQSHFSDAHINLGNIFLQLNKLEEARDYYFRALEITPDIPEVYKNLGDIHHRMNNSDEAIRFYQKTLSLRADFFEAEHLLNSLTGVTTDTAPVDYVRNVFDQYSHTFESSLVDQLGYRAHDLFKDVFLERGLLNKKFNNAIDLGCGTGLCGGVFRKFSEKLTGIDISQGMIKKAREKNIYDDLYVGDLIPGLQQSGFNFDLALAADVLVYIGNLEPLFREVKEHLSENAYFIFSTEHFDNEDSGGFVLQKTGRYAHTKTYIQRCASASGFQLEHFRCFDLRKEKKGWITGGLYLLRCK